MKYEIRSMKSKQVRGMSQDIGFRRRTATLNPRSAKHCLYTDRVLIHEFARISAHTTGSLVPRRPCIEKVRRCGVEPLRRELDLRRRLRGRATAGRLPLCARRASEVAIAGLETHNGERTKEADFGAVCQRCPSFADHYRLRSWTRRESNPRPKIFIKSVIHMLSRSFYLPTRPANKPSFPVSISTICGVVRIADTAELSGNPIALIKLRVVLQNSLRHLWSCRCQSRDVLACTFSTCDFCRSLGVPKFRDHPSIKFAFSHAQQRIVNGRG